MRRYLKAMLIWLIALLFGQMAWADVTHNVTFTVKNDGTVQATTDIGSFISDILINVAGADLPAELRQGSEPGSIYEENFGLDSPIGFNIMSETGPGGYKIPLSFRLVYFQAYGNWVRAVGGGGQCQSGGVGNDGIHRFTTEGKPYGFKPCSTRLTYTSSSTVYNRMFFEQVQFHFLENTGGKDGLSQLKAPAGTYDFAPQTFRLFHYNSGQPTTVVNWVVKARVVIEPAIGAVSIPNTLPLDVAVETGNRVTGKGSVLATVTGTLGQNLKILPSSANNGQLVKGSERIPYTLSVVPLSGDNKSRLLIDGNNGGAQPEVVMSTDDILDQYQLRFDASFSSTLGGLSTGRFSDNVTLMFTTTDMP